MPQSEFGVTSLGTNQTLRVRITSSYEDWDSSLSSGDGTATEDDRFDSPRAFTYSPYAIGHFLIYSN